MFALLLLLVAIDLEPRSADGLRGTLRLELPAEPEGIGLAGVWLHLHVAGSPTVEIDGPRLEDPLAAWRERVRLSAWQADGGVTRSIYLVQRKPGPVPLPDVIVRVRARPDTAWTEWTWQEPLGASRPVAPVELTPSPPEAGWGAWPWFLMVGVLITVIGVISRRWRRTHPVAETKSPQTIALERLLQVPATEVGGLLRDYLKQAFGLECVSLTRPEVQRLLTSWPEPLRRELDVFLAQSEAARFGREKSEVDRERIAAWIAASGKLGISGKNKESE
jgi:hypothetical protein